MSGYFIDKLQKLQNRTEKVIMTKSRFDTNSNLFPAMLKLEKLSLRRKEDGLNYVCI